ncbi:hypothetical protein [[Eubacterium] hominis]|uniref:hypothetical protein n=1 Tax=[Eubacterium] hominis TaxID=2764325 RepID=UPI003A4E363C
MKEMKKNDGATFIVEIKSQVNHSWQGKLTWVDQKETKHFRSALEMIKMIDSVVSDDEEN